MSERKVWTLRELAPLFKGVKWTPDRKSFTCLCPAHDDHDNSMSVRVIDGRAVLHCFTGCSQESAKKLVGIWEENPQPGQGRQARKRQKRPKAPSGPRPFQNEDPAHVTVYEYRTVGGETVYVFRLDKPGQPKVIRRWPNNIEGPYLPLDFPNYGHWPERGYDLANGLVICEGEATSTAIYNAGWCSTTCIGGVSGLDSTDWSSIRDRKVILFPDADDAGRKFMLRLRPILQRQGCQVLMVPTEDLPEKHDAADLKEAQISERIRMARGQIMFETYEEMKMEHVDWLVEKWIQIGALTVLGGWPGRGKTTLACKLAALVSTGGEWVDGTPIPQGKVACFFGEDLQSSVIKPNLVAAGADLSMIYHMRDVEHERTGEPVPFDPSIHMPMLKREMPADTRLLILDPALSVAMRVKEEFKPTEMRDALLPVKRLAEERHIAVFMISHYKKGAKTQEGGDPINWFIGSAVWGQVARQLHILDVCDQGQFYGRVKGSNAPTNGVVLYDIEEARVPNRDEPDKPDYVCKRIEFGELVEGEPRDLMNTEGMEEAEERATKFNIAIEWLEARFGRMDRDDGEKWTETILASKEDKMPGPATMRRARDKLKAQGIIEKYTIQLQDPLRTMTRWRPARPAPDEQNPDYWQ